MNNIEQYKKRFYNLMESTMGDVRPIISEQPTTPPRPGTSSKPTTPPSSVTPYKPTTPPKSGTSSKPNTTTNDLKGKTVNLYHDSEMQKVWGTTKIVSTVKSANGATLSMIGESGESNYDYDCTIPNQIKSSASEIYYNKQLTDSLNSQFCQTGQGGANVPKADMASNNSANSGQEPQSV
jgi:hypothetical protein